MKLGVMVVAERTPDTHITEDGRQPEVMAGYLVVPVEGCTCDGGGEFPHRAECGYEPAVPLAEVEAAIARARRADGLPVSGVTDDMVEVAAHADAKWDGLDWSEVSEHWQQKTRDRARSVLSAALAGCTPVVLPEPDANGDYSSGYSAVWIDGGNRVASAFGSLRPENAESYGLALIAAAREARRLSGGSQVGDQ